MEEVNVKEARRQLSALLDRVEQGEEIIITRRGKQVARLSPNRGSRRPRSLRKFRNSLDFTGKPMSRIVAEGRDEERYG